MENLPEVSAETQALRSPETLEERISPRKVGWEIVPSAELTHRCFRGPGRIRAASSNAARIRPEARPLR
jgi:hypothetical protein